MKSQVRQYIRLTLVVAAASFLTYIVAREWIGMFHLHYVSYDYAFFYYAFQSVIHHQASFHNLYNLDKQMVWLRHLGYPKDPYNQYVYPPQFAVLFGWLGWLPFRISALVWMACSVAAYFASLWYLVKLLWAGTAVRRSHVLIWCVVAVVVTPFEIDVIAGNVNSLLFFAVCMCFYLLYAKNRPRLAGVPLGLAILFKVTPAAVLLIFLLKKQWRVCIWTFITMIVGTVITAFVVGLGPVFAYMLHFLSLGQNSMRNGPAPYNQSIVGVIGMLQQHGWMFGGKWIQNIFFFGFVVWVLRGIQKYVGQVNDWRLDMAMACMCPLLFSPLVEEMHLLYVIPALMVFIRLAYNPLADRYKKNHEKLNYLVIVALACVCLLSLPVTYALNYVTGHWPALAWIEIQMFVVLVTCYWTVITLYRKKVHKVGPRAHASQSSSV